MNEGATEASYSEIRKRVFSGIWDDLDPLANQIETDEKIPYDIVLPALRKMGAFGLLVPREYGGSGLSIKQYLPIIAEFAKCQGGIRAMVHVHNSFAHALADIGSPAQCEEVLPGAATGERSIAFGLTEPGFGTGADLGSTAARDGDDYVINGKKWMITNSDIASHFMLMVKTQPKEVTALLVPRDTPGLEINRLPETMGCKGGEHGVLTLTDARVNSSALIGSEGMGQEYLEKSLEISRVLVAASSWGTSERCLELSLAHAKARVTFGKSISERQAIQRYLAEMSIDVYAMRTMLLDAADKWDRGERIPAEASMCKQFCLEAVGRVTDRALLIHGGIGYTRQLPIERLYRDARLNWLEEGTPTIQYLVTARAMLDGFTFKDGFSAHA